MAPSNGPRRRIGRTLRRPRGAAAAPLKVIEENTVVGISQHASPEKKTGGKRKRESTMPKAKSKTESKGPKRKAKAKPRQEFDKKTEKANQLLAELEKQLEKRCADLLADAERKAEELRMELKVQLMFLPESVRAMPWKTFIEDFGGSLENVIQNVKEQDYINYVTSQQGLAAVSSPKSALKIRPVPSTVRSKDRNSHGNTPGSGGLAAGLITPGATVRDSFSGFQTPLFTPLGSAVPSTVLRTARKGETTYSIRGSPIIPDTVVKAPAGALVATFNEDAVEPTACITLDSDTALDLSNPDQLSEETRAQARAKLEALQAKVNALLRQFK
ncbi:hypothetical protein Poli38472_008937 [Pythium oligandrum]|uniref:Borealin N-terminal domain-containing protein n=1 Tax=Pythium oligandrum TaxID=41045 RepID=A0A8K1C4D0_PYTOL|nr:hypothetical protein Poli38472_008937 [Pythium oligandrum]|eukprot:TMW56289.1 hypothetical protein Poli38472_008937 [Pythium oligandrum]